MEKEPPLLAMLANLMIIVMPYCHINFALNIYISKDSKTCEEADNVSIVVGSLTTPNYSPPSPPNSLYERALKEVFGNYCSILKVKRNL